MAHLLDNSLDLVNAARVPVSEQVFRAGHAVGNPGFSRLIAMLFGKQISDVLSGYRARVRPLIWRYSQ